MRSCFCRLIPLILLAFAAPAAARPLTFEVSPFGNIEVYTPSHSTKGVVLFASGSGGWQGEVVEMAENLAADDRLVVGIDLQSYLRGIANRRQSCPAGDFESLGKEVQRKLNFTEFHFPVLAGYAEGGALVYTALAEAPTNFLGAVSIGFCPELSVSHKPCPGWGFKSQFNTEQSLLKLIPASDLRYPWIVMEGSAAKSCDANDFISAVPHAEKLVTNPNRTIADLKESIEKISRSFAVPAPGSGLADLPVVEMNGGGSGDTLVILISGDGGWVSLDREIALYLQSKGIAVLGFDSLRYFWSGRKPKEAARDMSRILSYYLPAWKKKYAILAGYSFGADVVPFILKRSHGGLKELRGVALIGPSGKVDFKTGPLAEEPEKEKQIFPTLASLKGIHLLCVGGLLERPPSLCKRLQEDKMTAKEFDIQFFDSGHMFGMDPQPISDLLIRTFHLQ